MSMENRDGVIWMDGALVPWTSARVHVLSHTLHHGTGIFEGVRVYATECGPAIFRLADHTRRFFCSAKILGMELPFSAQELNEAQIEVVRSNRLEECYIRPIAFHGGEVMGVSARGNAVHVGIAAWSWNAYLGSDAKSKGIRVKTSSYARHHPNSVSIHAKASGNYLNSVFANREAVQQGFDEALMLDTQGFAAEGSSENLFIVKDGIVITPDASTVLQGITRDTVMQLACDRCVRVVEARITRDQIYCADEAFFTGTAAEITPIRELDGIPIGAEVPGPLTRLLQEAYFATVRGGNDARANWLSWVSESTHSENDART